MASQVDYTWPSFFSHNLQCSAIFMLSSYLILLVCKVGWLDLFVLTSLVRLVLIYETSRHSHDKSSILDRETPKSER